MLTNEFPTPAAGCRATDPSHGTVACTNQNSGWYENGKSPGTLPDCAVEISKSARGLLVRLLDPEPRVRMRNIRQLQQSAFYMGYNFEHVKTKQINPKSILQRHFPEGVSSTASQVLGNDFATFDQPHCDQSL